MEAHLLAIRKLLDCEREPGWQENLQGILSEMASGE